MYLALLENKICKLIFMFFLVLLKTRLFRLAKILVALPSLWSIYFQAEKLCSPYKIKHCLSEPGVASDGAGCHLYLSECNVAFFYLFCSLFHIVLKTVLKPGRNLQISRSE